ncbi:MAG: DnaB-like helicase C-terminal domain-containing protein [Myxococcota bacterium]
MTPNDPQTANNLVDFLQDRVYPALDPALVLQDLAPRDKGRYYVVRCPKCDKREAYIYKDGFMLRCNRLNKCGYTTLLIDYLNGGVRARGADFAAAVRKLSNIAGVPLPERYARPRHDETDQAARLHGRVHLLEAFVALAGRALHDDDGQSARDYLQRRGFAPDQWETFEFGLCPKLAVVTSRLLAQGFSTGELEQSGLLHDARWEGRLVGPWRDRRGNAVNFWARAVTPDATPKYLYLKGGSKAVPFGMHLVKSKEVIVTEGIFDVLSLHARGLDNAVGLGGSQLGDEVPKSLRRCGVETATVHLDYDPVGDSRERTIAVAQKLHEAGLRVHVIDPEHPLYRSDAKKKMDPDLYAASHDKSGYDKLLASKTGWQNAAIALYAKGFTKKDGINQEKCLEEICKVIEKTHSPIARELVLEEAEKQTSVKKEILRKEVALISKKQNEETSRRQLLSLLQQQQHALNNTPVKNVVSSLLTKAQSIAFTFSEDDPQPFRVDSLVDKIRSSTRGKQTGWAPLDHKGIRFHPTELTVIAARTGHGKTTVLLSLLLNWMRDYPQETFLFNSYELPPESILLKLASMLTRDGGGEGWSYYEIKDYLQGKPRDEGYPPREELNHALATLRSWESRFVLAYRPTWNVHCLASYARRVHARAHGLGGVLIDYLQLIPPATQDLGRRDMEISAVARGLKALAIELDCPVITAAQIGRQALLGCERIPEGSFTSRRVQEAIQKRRPQLHHLREGGSEQEADLVLGLLNYRADYVGDHRETDEHHDTCGPLEINVLKNRFGELGTCKMTLEGTTGTIRPMEHRQ